MRWFQMKVCPYVALAVHLDVDVYQQPAARRSKMGKN
jgi:hypothetical protein